MRHFLDLNQIDSSVLREIIERAKTFKLGDGLAERPLDGKILALIFEKPSTRTRVSFEAGMKRLGGEVIMLNSSDLQLARGETLSDTAKVLSCYVDCIMMRTLLESTLVELAENANVPVINGLTNRSHPCQLMADVMTFEEHCGPIKDKVIAWSGDGNNMAASWIQAAVQFDFVLHIACPPDLMPSQTLIDWAKCKGGRVYINHDPFIAVADADAVVTDTWVSMGDVDSNRHNLLATYRVDDALMAKAKPNSVFMHCMPANRGKDVSAEVIDGPQSLVFNEAENRMYSQMAILYWCLSETRG
ncbi:ornithine carbamoyltransferase [Candidatus Endolissoclinum faulkneri L5]|uniref:Ornithine carbamoyltransferase n=1 Tax=Candidatus Endolissoclinum faulkneri L5 TaxID=1401328 RepID=V9TTP2_9PROT|nr:ornithine carbamoyltransferase [Candidatus Endolissoclinum faulkneri]AHC73537.1 ornithine carbamoyltransferase [Candidatus Endolissoclinum faulkneri L5]